MIELSKLVIFSMALIFSNGLIVEAETVPCEERARQPLVQKDSSGISSYSFFVDKEPPYQYSHDHYAHERFSFEEQIKVHIEHRGCPFPDKSHNIIEFTLPGKFKSREDTQFWISKAVDLLSSLKVCHPNLSPNWCDRLKRAQNEKLTYRVNSSAPYNEGIWLSLDQDKEHNEIFLILKVSEFDDHVVFEVGTAFVGYDG